MLGRVGSNKEEILINSSLVGLSERETTTRGRAGAISEAQTSSHSSDLIIALMEISVFLTLAYTREYFSPIRMS